MAQINPVSKTFIGHTTLTTANANEFLCVKARTAGSPVSADGTPVVALSTAHGTNNFDEIIGVYIANPGHEGNPVSVNVSGQITAQVAAAITIGDMNKGIVSGVTTGIGEVGPAPADGAAKVGFGRIIGGFSEGGKHYAILLA